MKLKLKDLKAIKFGVATEKPAGIQLFTLNLPFKPDEDLFWVWFQLQIKAKILFINLSISPKLSIRIVK